MIASCNICRKRGVEPFTVPYDDVGVTLMEQHLEECQKKLTDDALAFVLHGEIPAQPAQPTEGQQ